MYSFLCVAPRSRASKKGREGIGRKSEHSRRNEPFALFTREKRQKMRDVVEGKVNGARINILAWMEDDRGERRTAEEKGDRTRGEAGIANERTKEGGKELCDDGAHSGRFYSREALVAAGRFRTINSVLWSAKSYDGNRVNHTGTRSRVRRPRVSVWDARGHILAPHAYTLHVSGRA